MGHWCFVGDLTHLNSLARKATKRGFAPRAYATDHHFHLLYADDICFVSHELSHFRGCERCPFLGTCETERAGRRPRDRVAGFVGKKDFRVVVRRMDMERTCYDVFLGDTRERTGLHSLINNASGFSNDSFLSHGLCLFKLTATRSHRLSHVAAYGP